ncbi:type II toxin-antitoxin system RelB/DinJ family antitoxin [Lentilactobacillus farraginis]|uniref:type II toxin-antitoxin system RelB/DinJ family antitoxin n=1 Tax=Lentilactobacillus farraginis TaxID=390841 RepID=UPI0005573BB8|nr:type II toxin-antitoxin system RelB/DinJ family antitoxin [Lentilactobacillus farraginis]
MTNTPKNKKHIQVQVDKTLYDASKRVLNNIGISQSALINALLRRVVAEGRVPFDLAQTKSERLNFELERQIRHSNIPLIKSPKNVDRYLLENGDNRYDEHK